MEISLSACPSSDEKVLLFGLLMDTNARLSKDFGVELEANCQMPLAWFEVLLQLRQSSGGRLRMSEVADAISHSTGGTTRLIDRLVEADFVQREHCPSDRRSIFVGITEAGNEKLDEALGVHLSYLDERIAKRLSNSERADLASLLTKLNASH